MNNKSKTAKMKNRKQSKQSLYKSAPHVSQLVGLNTLKRVFERDFFAQATLGVVLGEKSKVDLIIHLYCNFGLTESLFHLNNGNWGNFQNAISGDIRTSPFHTTLLELENDNGLTMDIKELSIHLRDTSIVITRLPDFQIQDNLESILNSVSSNFVHFTKGLSQLPYEIFVPVYEETENSLSHSSEKKSSKKPGYLDLWGLYFEGEEDSAVYDVKNKVIIEQSNFFLLNQWG